LLYAIFIDSCIPRFRGVPQNLGIVSLSFSFGKRLLCK
jgi:hypothetical protein